MVPEECSSGQFSVFEIKIYNSCGRNDFFEFWLVHIFRSARCILFVAIMLQRIALIMIFNIIAGLIFS